MGIGNIGLYPFTGPDATKLHLDDVLWTSNPTVPCIKLKNFFLTK